MVPGMVPLPLIFVPTRRWRFACVEKPHGPMPGLAMHHQLPTRVFPGLEPSQSASPQPRSRPTTAPSRGRAKPVGTSPSAVRQLALAGSKPGKGERKGDASQPSTLGRGRIGRWLPSGYRASRTAFGIRSCWAPWFRSRGHAGPLVHHEIGAGCCTGDDENLRHLHSAATCGGGVPCGPRSIFTAESSHAKRGSEASSSRMPAKVVECAVPETIGPGDRHARQKFRKLD